MTRRMHDERGSALLVAIVFTVILTTTVGGVVALLNASTAATTRSTRVQVSLQLAEAGVEKAAALLRADRNYAGEQNAVLGEGTFSTVVTSGSRPELYHVVSTASLSPDNAHPTRIEAELAVTPEGSRIVAWREFVQ